jgi:putative Mn2+ efflux pump MntP
MPLVGVLAGHTLGALTGSLSEWLAAAVLIGVGVWFLVRRDEGEEKRASRLLSANPLMAAALGVSISLDELAIGIQTVVGSQLGLALGALIRERVREGAERLAGVAFVALGLFLIVERVV